MALATLRLNLDDVTGPGKVGEILIRPLSSSYNTAKWSSTKAGRIPLSYSDPVHASTDPAYSPEYTLLDGTKYPQVTQGAQYEFTIVRVNGTKDGTTFTAAIPATATVNFSDLAPLIPVPPLPDLTYTQSQIDTKLADSVFGTAYADLTRQPGVDATGATDSGAAVQTALDAFAGFGYRAYAKGTIKTSTTLTIKGSCDLSDLVVNYTGTGTAVVVGSTGANLLGLKVDLPKIRYANKPSVGWTAGTIGAQLVNLYTSTIIVPQIRDFEIGLQTLGVNSGNVYNTYHLGHLHNNKINLDCNRSGTGWSNQNTYIGGRFQHLPAEGTDVADTKHIRTDATANNNVFLNPSLESTGTTEYMLDVAGFYNVFKNARFESTGARRVIWRASSFLNRVEGGYESNVITETREAGSAKNVIESHGGSRLFAAAGNGIVAENSNSSAQPIWTIMAAGADTAQANPSTAYLAQIAASGWKFKGAADTNERVRIDPVTGRIYFGPGGVTAPVGYIDGTATVLRINGASLAFDTDNTRDIGPGGALRPRYVRAGTALVTGSGITAARPSASTAGAGASFFDTTLGKPVFSDGTNWNDAATATTGLLRHPDMTTGRYYGATFVGTGYTTNAVTIGTAYYDLIYVPNAITLSALTSGTAGTIASLVFNLGIYNSTADGSTPTTLIAGGTVAGVTPGSYNVAVSTTLAPGFYWLALLMTGGASTGAIQSTSGYPGIPVRGETTPFAANSPLPPAFNQTGLSALPSTATPVAATTSARPRVLLKVA